MAIKRLPYPVRKDSSFVKTMSSREIAVLTGKRHADVLRDVRVMIKRLSADATLSWHCKSSTYLDEQTKTRDMFLLDKNTTITLVSGYDTILRFKIIKRWQELESRPKDFIEDVVEGMKRAEVKLMGFNQMSLESRNAMKALQWEIQGILGLRSKSQMYRRIKMREPLNLLINGMSSGEFRRRIGLRLQNRDSNNHPMKTCDFLPLANQYALYRTDLLLSEFLRTNDFNVTYAEACTWYLRYGEVAKAEAEKQYQVNLHNLVIESLLEILGYVDEQMSEDVSPYTETQVMLQQSLEQRFLVH